MGKKINMANFKNISVVGAGTMGNGIAHVFALHNYKVNLIDLNQEVLDKARNTIENNLDRMVAKDKISIEQKTDTLNNISSYTNLEQGVANADLVVEAVSETYSIKQSVFKQLDKFAPKNAILASNTSSISITKIGAETSRPEKVIGMHFMNPVPVMKLVEIINGYSTSEETTRMVLEVSKSLNKIPIPSNDYPGFIANRILMPMINEAIFAVFEGVGGAEEIDQVMKLGMAHPMGPLQLADFIGLDVCLSILNVLYEGFKNPKYAPCPLLVNMVTAGKLGRKSGEGFYDYSVSGKDLIVSESFKHQ